MVSSPLKHIYVEITLFFKTLCKKHIATIKVDPINNPKRIEQSTPIQEEFISKNG